MNKKDSKKVSTIASHIQEDEVASSPTSIPEDGKYKVTFLGARKLLGKVHEEGESMEVEAWVFDAYKADTRLRFEKIS